MATTKKSEGAEVIYSNITITKKEGSMLEIVGSIPAAKFASYRTDALKNINNEVTVDGFRKGKVPEKNLIEKVGEMSVLYEMAELALSKAYPAIVIGEKLDVIGHPQISITKIAADNDLEFKIETAITPEVKLGDFKAAASEVNKTPLEKSEVTDEELAKILEELRHSHAERLAHDALHAMETPEQKASGAHDHDKISEDAIKEHLPELNDSFAQLLGNFASLDELKKKIKENVTAEKAQKVLDKRRLVLADALLAEAVIDLPSVLVETELNRSEAQFRDDIARMGIKLEEYLKHIKKSVEDLRNDWKDSAAKKAKLQLILNTIAKSEKIVAAPEDVEAEVSRITDHYKDADRERAHVYAESVLTNELVFKFLEEQKG